jgi:hypothetical protein
MAVFAVLPAAAGAWSRPVQIAPPTSISVLGPQAAASVTGAAAVSFNEVNLDAQATASSFLALAPPHGSFSAAHAVPGAQEVLAVAYAGTALELLTASAPPGQPCCTTVQTIRRGPRGGFGRRQTLVTDVGGGTTGQLVPLAGGRTLAVIAGPQRLWASEASAAGQFGAVRGLTPPGSGPAAVAATGTTDGGSTVAWTRGAAQSVSVASAGPRATPSRSRTLLTLAPGHAIDGLQLAPRPDGLTMGWTDSWNDAAGNYHAQAMAADLAAAGGRLTTPRALSAPGELASGLVLSSDAVGAEVAAWDVCAPTSPACVLEGRVRPGEAAVPAKHGKARKRVAARGFGALAHLGPIDPGESPELAIAPASAPLLGWITGGRVALAIGRAGSVRTGPALGAARLVSGGLADNLAVGVGPTGEAVAAWTQGSAAPVVFVSVGR